MKEAVIRKGDCPLMFYGLCSVGQVYVFHKQTTSSSHSGISNGNPKVSLSMMVNQTINNPHIHSN